MSAMPSSNHSLPAVPASNKDLGGVIERVISHVPAPRTREVDDPDRAADEIARAAARQAAILSGSLALPPGPLGMVTVLPDLYLIWKTQRQMVADIFGLYGRAAELSRSHMLYCLFRHAASQVMRDFVVRTGQRIVIEQLSGGAIKHVAGKVGVASASVSRGAPRSRWVPLAGAAAVGAYAYWDTLQVAKTARRLLADEIPQRKT